MRSRAPQPLPLPGARLCAAEGSTRARRKPSTGGSLALPQNVGRGLAVRSVCCPVSHRKLSRVPARVLFIGLDAAEATLLETWAGTGDLPTFKRLMDAAPGIKLDNSLETLPGAIWPEITTGRACHRDALYFHPRQLHTGEVAARAVTPEEIDPRTFYTVASDAGRRVAVVDLPQVPLASELNGVHITEWGLHDRNFEIGSYPRELLDDLRVRHGDHPIGSCDEHGGTSEGYARLLAGLLAGVPRKTDLLLDVLGSEQWDLFACAYGESHCVGHQFWGRRDSAPGDPLREVYRRIDAGVGALIDAAGPDAAVLVLASHGMGEYLGGPQLLPEVLVRLGMGSGSGLAVQLRSRLPGNARTLLRRFVPASLRRPLQARAASLPQPLASSATRAIALDNNRCGAIRLNLRGREPFGCVAPGVEAATLLDELRRELLRLEHPASGEPIVASVKTAVEAFGDAHHPDVPDIMVVFRTDLGPLESCRSNRVGTVEVPLYKPHLPRVGDHTTESRLWMLGMPAPPVPVANVLDIAPTVLSLLDVALPDWLDGRPLATSLAAR
jgi:predicted AlkP superfamily phosphohydrolase/phosphomutase